MAGMVHLKSPSGTVIDFSLPLHEAIMHQWRNGDLQRVTKNGAAWTGDPFNLDGSPARAAAALRTGDGQPARPVDSAPKKAWQDYAAAIGAVPGEEAAGMARADLIAACTPPELLGPGA
ncbi:MAG: hypothetical protein ACRDP5_24130 [Streptosporangiaceae bacterium]